MTWFPWGDEPDPTRSTVYDAAGRLIRKEYPDSTIEEYTYNNNGNLLQAVNSVVTVNYAYDARNLLTSITNATINKTVSYTYNENVKKISLTYPDGETISFNRDTRGQIAELWDDGSRVLTYRYTSSGVLDSTDYDFGLHAERAYDDASRLTRLHWFGPSGSISDFNYTHDAAGNILSKSTDFGNITYSYDDLNRLSGTEYDWKPDEIFSYDAAGNRLASADYDTWSYDTANQLLSYGNGGSTEMSFTYNNNGSTTSRNIVGGDATQFLYSADNRIEEVKINDETTARYYYDHKSQRVKKELYTGGMLNETIWYLYGTEGMLVEYDQTETLIKKYQFHPDRPWGTDPLWQEDATNTRAYFINDHLLTPQEMLDESFINVWKADWAAFGEIDISTSIIETDLRYSGQYYDIETKMSYNWHRHYISDCGRYCQTDDEIDEKR